MDNISSNTDPNNTNNKNLFDIAYNNPTLSIAVLTGIAYLIQYSNFMVESYLYKIPLVLYEITINDIIRLSYVSLFVVLDLTRRYSIFHNMLPYHIIITFTAIFFLYLLISYEYTYMIMFSIYSISTLTYTKKTKDIISNTIVIIFFISVLIFIFMSREILIRNKAVIMNSDLLIMRYNPDNIICLELDSLYIPTNKIHVYNNSVLDSVTIVNYHDYYREMLLVNSDSINDDSLTTH